MSGDRGAVSTWDVCTSTVEESGGGVKLSNLGSWIENLICILFHLLVANFVLFFTTIFYKTDISPVGNRSQLTLIFIQEPKSQLTKLVFICIGFIKFPRQLKIAQPHSILNFLI